MTFGKMNIHPQDVGGQGRRSYDPFLLGWPMFTDDVSFTGGYEQELFVVSFFVFFFWRVPSGKLT